MYVICILKVGGEFPKNCLWIAKDTFKEEPTICQANVPVIASFVYPTKCTGFVFRYFNVF